MTLFFSPHSKKKTALPWRWVQQGLGVLPLTQQKPFYATVPCRSIDTVFCLENGHFNSKTQRLPLHGEKLLNSIVEIIFYA
jgi:hypothetical protein